MTIISKRVTQILKSKILFILFISGILTACTITHLNVSSKMLIPAHARIGVGPFANHSSTPLANRQVETMLVGMLQAKGFVFIKHYEHRKSCAKLLYCPDETITKEQILHWARAHRLAYVFTGAANEWRYKVGLDGEPVAGVTLALTNVHTGQVVWTAVGSGIGGSRTGLDVVGQTLLNRLLKNLLPIINR